MVMQIKLIVVVVESGATSHTNTMATLDSTSGWNSSFTTETSILWSESADLKFIASTEEKRGQQQSAEQRPSFSTTKTTPSARKRGTVD